MVNKIIEASYPIGFRKKESSELGVHLKNRSSVVLIGMKRVGISNFLRFLLNHRDFPSAYIKDGKKHLFISVDLNDLVEREIFPFWILTLKRILDVAENDSLDLATKQYIEKLFLESMQSKDIFLTIESIKKSFVKLVDLGILSTIFFIRFDRIKDVATPEFFSNLHGLKDATNQKLAFVFTSYRSLESLAPETFPKSSLSLFAKDVFIKPAIKEDTRIVFDTYKGNYSIPLSLELENSLFEIVDGYIQYLQLSLVALRETDKKFQTKQEIFDFLSKDERIILQSEELWESLENEEKTTLLKVSRGEEIGREDRRNACYLWDTGFIVEKSSPFNKQGKRSEIFSGLFAAYVRKIKDEPQNQASDFTKKENLLFNFLKDNLKQLCEREKIIESVWPEVEELGVSDWAIDRLVARVRVKLKLQNAPYEIQTVKTRGYKMVES